MINYMLNIKKKTKNERRNWDLEIFLEINSLLSFENNEIFEFSTIEWIIYIKKNFKYKRIKIFSNFINKFYRNKITK